MGGGGNASPGQDMDMGDVPAEVAAASASAILEPLDKLCFAEADKPRTIEHITFGLLSSEDITRTAEFQVTERNLYSLPSRVPLAGGVLDPRLGTSDKKGECVTCKGKLTDCAGHYGYIKLELPVFHIGYFKSVLTLLQCICKRCGRVLLPEEGAVEASRHTEIMLAAMRRGGDVGTRRRNLKKVVDACKRCKLCPHCGATNGAVRKVASALRITHDPWGKDGAPDDITRELVCARERNRELESHLGAGRVQDDLTPVRVLELFSRMEPRDCELLDLRERPERLILTHVTVPPVCIRPSVEMVGQAGTNEDDITMTLMQVVEVNNSVRKGLEGAIAPNNLAENWDFLQLKVAQLVNSELPGLPPSYQGNSKPVRGFVQRLKGKQGRFRGNLSGKRVDFSGRTVISPDPNLRIDQVCVPEYVAKTLTFPEPVNRYNRDRLAAAVRNGCSRWPGANFVSRNDGQKVYLKFKSRAQIAEELVPGDVVERHLRDDDVVLFNRQPSLHKMSIMAHKVKVAKWRTFRFNECVCAPYNADFDGDEMNLHVPQTFEARAEALHLMGVHRNLCTPKNGEALVCATQDFLTAAFLLTRKDSFLDRSELGLLLSCMELADSHVHAPPTLPPPAIFKPVELWTGKQLFGILLHRAVTFAGDAPKKGAAIMPTPGEFGSTDVPGVTFILHERTYAEGEHMCLADGYVHFVNGSLLSGRLGKGTLGGSKGGLFSVLNRERGAGAAAATMNILARISARWIGERGFSIGIGDVSPGPALREKKQEAVNKGYSLCDGHIASFHNGSLVLQAGCDADQTLEAKVTGELNKIREETGRVCQRELGPHNSTLVMAQAGSKGSAINISQMVACVGQQTVGGQRAPEGFLERSLPHFARRAREPAAKGFVANSFYTGLTPTEFFFHTMGGREGLVDTAVKTAETGYMSRRLMKALEDLSAQYDGTVRNSSSAIVQLVYGDDGLDPVLMEGSGKPVEFARAMRQVVAEHPRGGATPLGAKGLGSHLEAVLREALTEADGLQGMEQVERVLQDAMGDLMSDAELGAGDLALAPGTSPGDGTRRSFELALGQFVRALRQFCEKVAAEVDARAATVGLGADWEAVAAAQAAGDIGAAAAAAPSQLDLELLGGLTTAQLSRFCLRCVRKLARKRVEPGSAVGAVGAQSIGEPGTQMTLKTFHFAGVASMNVTLGVPRIKEIINASKNISTPIIRVELLNDKDETAARMVKARIEKTTLGDVASSVRSVLLKRRCYIEIRLDMDAIAKLQLRIDVFSVKDKVLEAPKLKIDKDQIKVISRDTFLVLVDGASGPTRGRAASQAADDSAGGRLAGNPFFRLQALRAALPGVIVRGIASVERAVINQDKGRYHLLVEGNNMAEVMGTEGVLGEQTKTNHVMEAEKTLGIEAARSTIIDQIEFTMGSHGMSIDRRHSMLLADVMTYKGEVLGITRFGIAKMKESVLMLASFEKTTDHLFDAALHGRVDKVDGVSECIIMGMPAPVGTGGFKLIQHDVAAPAVDARGRPRGGKKARRRAVQSFVDEPLVEPLT